MRAFLLVITLAVPFARPVPSTPEATRSRRLQKSSARLTRSGKTPDTP